MLRDFSRSFSVARTVAMQVQLLPVFLSFVFQFQDKISV